MTKEDKILKSFTFHVPVELVKASGNSSEDDDSEDSWKIQGIASTGDEDLQGEQVFQDGLDLAVLKAGRGLFNNDHQKGPENILGQIDDAELVNHAGKEALMVKGYLFKHQDRAKAYYNIMRSVRKGSSPRVHFSIEGKVIERDMSHTSKIRKAMISKVALTLDPVNVNTFANLCKSLNADIKITEQQEFFDEVMTIVKERVEKAISAGTGYANAPASRTGGEAMGTESLASKVKTMTYKKLKKDKKSTKRMLKSIIEAVSRTYTDVDPIEIAEMICKSYKLKLKEF